MAPPSFVSKQQPASLSRSLWKLIIIHSLLYSKQVTFLIGTENRLIIIYAGDIAKHLEPLDRLVNVRILEAQQNVARLADLQV